MFDITVTSCSLEMYIYCFVLYFSYAFLYWRNNVVRHGTELSAIQTKHQSILPFLILISLLTAFSDGDYWHYQQFVKGGAEELINEEVYHWIAKIGLHNYLLFRFIVWGTAFLLFLTTIKRTGLSMYNGCYFLFVLYIFTFSYARVSLAMSYFFLGITLLDRKINNTNNILKTTLGFLIILTSYFLHHSIFPLIVFTVLSFINIKRKQILICLGFLPILGIFLKFVVFEYIFTFNLSGLTNIVEKTMIYIRTESEEISFLEKVREVWLFSLFYIPFLYATYKLIWKSQNNVPVYILIMYRISFYIVLLTMAILSLGLPNNILFYRYLYMLMIPNTVLVTYMVSNGIMTKSECKILLLYAMGYNFFRGGKKALGWSGPIE